jgi:hypothetical protein
VKEKGVICLEIRLRNSIGKKKVCLNDLQIGGIPIKNLT